MHVGRGIAPFKNNLLILMQWTNSVGFGESKLDRFKYHMCLPPLPQNSGRAAQFTSDIL